MRVTDGEMDGQNYDPQDHASIAALRGKNGATLFNSLCLGHIFQNFENRLIFGKVICDKKLITR